MKFDWVRSNPSSVKAALHTANLNRGSDSFDLVYPMGLPYFACLAQLACFAA
jgi:hypothetical protein